MRVSMWSALPQLGLSAAQHQLTGRLARMASYRAPRRPRVWAETVPIASGFGRAVASPPDPHRGFSAVMGPYNMAMPLL